VPEHDIVTSARARDISEIMRRKNVQTDRERAMDMPGFDPEFDDIVEYILRITYRIWEGGQPELVRAYYADDCVIHTLAGPVCGVEQVVENTRATLQAFPDRKLFGDDVIWSDEGAAGFYTSHRITSPMTHLGSGHWGPPTGRCARVRTIADCLVRDNVIYEEWLMRDGLAMALQLGLDPAALARRLAAEARDNAALQRWLAGEIGRVAHSPGRAEHYGFAPASAQGRVCELLEQLFVERDYAAVARLYVPTARMHGPSGRELFGHREIAHHARSLLGGLVETWFSIDHVAVNQSPDPGGDHTASVALRWTLSGIYARPGIYGPPTDARLLLLGASHFDLVGDRIVEEWTVFDELAVLAQAAGAIAQ